MCYYLFGKSCVLECFPDINKPVKFDALKETVVFQETEEKGLLGLRSKLCPVSDNNEITQQDGW